jgi:hypothetical protein
VLSAIKDEIRISWMNIVLLGRKLATLDEYCSHQMNIIYQHSIMIGHGSLLCFISVQYHPTGNDNQPHRN